MSKESRKSRRKKSLEVEKEKPRQESSLAFLWRDLLHDQSQAESSNAREEISNLAQVPWALEKLLFVTFWCLLDSLLFYLSVVPLRIVLALPRALFTRSLSLRDLSFALKCLVVVLTLSCLSFFDFGASYHGLKVQSTLKVYVIFNLLEVVDKIFASFGTEVFEVLDESLKEAATARTAKSVFACLGFTLVTLLYTVIHSLILFFQMVTLSVAINFSSSALVTVLVSNNFMELKSQLYKRVAPESLIQLCFADALERMQITAYIVLITIHNFSDLGWSLDAFWVEHTITYIGLVFVSEILVDWLKHSFVVKYNGLSTSWYDEGISIMYRQIVAPGDSAVNLEIIASRVRFVVVPFVAVLLKFLFASAVLDSAMDVVWMVAACFVGRSVLHFVLVNFGNKWFGK